VAEGAAAITRLRNQPQFLVITQPDQRDSNPQSTGYAHVLHF
jgi:hypothetical protein